jgi:group I intron endonuclease
MIIYKIVNNINGKIYVGQTRQLLQKRVSDHVSKNETPIDRALNKYGINNFTITIIDDAPSRDVLNEKEQYWIRELNCMAPNGYNLTAGGEGLLYPTEETRRKIGEKSRGRKWSDASREKLSSSKKGMTYHMTEKGVDNIRKATKEQTWTKERREKVSKALSGRKLSEEHVNNIRKVRTGWKYSEESKKKMSASRKLIMNDDLKKKIGLSKIGNKNFLGRKHTEETKKKISTSKMGHSFTEEAKKKMSLAHTGRRKGEQK